MEEFNFPKIKKTICDFLSEEDGSMTRKKVVAIGSILLIMSLLTPVDAYAKHRSHSSHPHGPADSSSRPARRTGEARRRPRARSDAAARRAAWRFPYPT